MSRRAASRDGRGRNPPGAANAFVGRPNIHRATRGSLGSALVLVGILAVLTGIVYYELSNVTGGFIPADPLLLYAGILLVFLGIAGIIVWKWLGNRVFS